jgi:hypothetical protein
VIKHDITMIRGYDDRNGGHIVPMVLTMILTIPSGHTVVVVVESSDSVVSDRLNVRRMSRIMLDSVVKSKKSRICCLVVIPVVDGAIPLQR